MYRPLHPLADGDPSVDAELVRMREDDEREAEIELLACGISAGSRGEFTKTERTWAEIEVDDAAFYDRYER